MNRYLMKQIENPDIPIVFDFDGVLFEARWYEDRINMRGETPESLLKAMQRGENLRTEPISFMTDFVPTLKNDKFVLSRMHNDIEYSYKKEQISRYYPCIPLENVIMATSIDNKEVYLEQIRQKYGAFIYIDDTHQALMKFENDFDDNCKFFHVSSLYV
ncbi:MAG: hypothetical protein J6U23_00375 [Clostridiales bacterium]|nr:hypothetical protein [Clostridiales bacterium]